MLPEEYVLTSSERFALKVKSALLGGLFRAYPMLPDNLIYRAFMGLLKIEGTALQKRFLGKSALTFKHSMRNVSLASREKIGKNIFINECLKGNTQRKKVSAVLGHDIPALIVISPTMRCPLRCYGCYSAQYEKDADLDYRVFDNLISDAKELGIFFFVISGGEPFVYPGILDLFKKHNDAWFQVYTSGVTLNQETVRRLADVGNVDPCISVEGFEEETDRRRGKGHFQKVMAAFEHMRRFKVPFGFSATATRENNDLIVSDEFLDFYHKQGAYIGWYFQYMPIGREPNFDLVPTPRQRIRRFYRMIELREKFDMFIADFWNDGWLTQGCLAGARRYIHVNHNGDIEPCVFCQIAVDNIYKKGLLETLKTSRLFKAIRERQPYNDNLLRPCMIIDNPEVLREVIEEVAPRETCGSGVQKLATELFSKLRKNADDYGVLADEAWERVHGNSGITAEDALMAAKEALKKY